VRRLGRRRLLWAALYLVALSVLVVALVLVGLGDLRLPSSGHAGPAVTVSRVDWTVLEGTTSHGQGWFGPAEFNYTPATGWQPPTFSAGTRLQVSWDLVNYDTTTQEIYSVTVGSPFELAGTGKGLPMVVNIGDDGNSLVLYITTPSSTSGTFPLDVTVNALNSG
jgi:hypothetical protein